MNLRQYGIPCALQPGGQCRVDAIRSQEWTLPVTFLHASAVDQVKVSDPHFSCRPEYSTQHFRPGESQDEVTGVPGQGSIDEVNLKVGVLVRQFDHRAAAPQPTQQPYSQGVTHLRLEDAADVLVTTVV
jgi:hypothetical protein